jgi:hypothetical protein
VKQFKSQFKCPRSYMDMRGSHLTTAGGKIRYDRWAFMMA